MSASKDVAVFNEADFPNMASHCPQSECGFSVYRGVLIQWDEDRDARILTFIDEMPDVIRSHLLVAQEHEGSLGLVWRNVVPKNYAEGDDTIVEEDVWSISSSKVAGK